MKVALCCIGRLENRYAVEFVEWYKKLGIDKIFVYDNNYDGEEHFEDVLQPYIDEGLVDIIDFRNKSVCQLEAYQDCYNNHSNEFDWICFFDFDEFLHIVNSDDIKKFLSNEKFDEFQCIHLNWMDYGDNSLINYEDKPLQERFKTPLPFDTCMTYNFPENFHVKSIIKCGIENFIWAGNPHTPNIDLKCCDCDGIMCLNKPFKKYNYNKCYIKHYFTKTIDEWLNNKSFRGYPDRLNKNINYYLKIENFFKLNERTVEKEEFIKNFFKSKKNNNLDIFVCTHKNFEQVVNNESYKTIDTREIISGENELKDNFYSEFFSMFYVERKINFKKYIGFCHYRRYFEFMDNIPDLDGVFSKSEIIAVKPITFKNTVREQYAVCHNIEDLYILSGIIGEMYPNYIDAWNNFLDGHLMFPYNMFIMKSDEFKEYIRFIKNILDKYVKIVGTDIYQRIENNKEKYLKDFSPNNTVEYQYRIGGYLGERLTNLWIIHNHKKIKAYLVKITENKYNLKSNTI